MKTVNHSPPISDDVVSTMQNPNFRFNHDPTLKHRGNYNRAKRPVLKIQPGQIGFRLVCHVSTVGVLIGNAGAVVSQLRRETSCKIHCVDPTFSFSTDDRVVLVIGSVFPRKGVTLVVEDDDGCESETEVVEVSNAQEAILRVFERVWEMGAEKSASVGKTINGEVWCRMLADTSQIGAVVGKGGKNISMIRNNSGAKIRVLPAPDCAAKNEELIQITGRVLAVKKALIAVSHCLQDCPPLGKVAAPLNTPTLSPPYMAPHDSQTKLFPHLNSPLTPVRFPYDPSKQTTQANGESRHDTKGTELEVVFRLLCSNNTAGSVIGRKGAIVRDLESKTGASIIFAPPLSKFAERIVTISAVENVESSNSPAQDAVILIFTRVIEDHIEKGLLSVVSMEPPVSMRLLVASRIISFLNGNEGQAISEMKEATGADIQIMRVEEVSCGASDNDMVVKITGDYRCVEKALYKVTSIIRGYILAHGEPALSSGSLLPQNAGAWPISENGKSAHFDLYDNLEVGRVNKLATVTNTTVEIAVSEHVFGSVYGEDGGNLDRIRQISGAKVTVYDPCAGESGGRVVISGTPDQTFAAQSLLQAFIQTGEKAPEN